MLTDILILGNSICLEHLLTLASFVSVFRSLRPPRFTYCCVSSSFYVGLPTTCFVGCCFFFSFSLSLFLSLSLSRALLRSFVRSISRVFVGMFLWSSLKCTRNWQLANVKCFLVSVNFTSLNYCASWSLSKLITRVRYLLLNLSKLITRVRSYHRALILTGYER